MPLPDDYEERVYAGVLGKIIGVYLGRPFEGWPHARILAELGEVDGYVHDRLSKPLVVTDDDIAGTFTFLRALPDHGCPRDLAPARIGQTWLNYIVEGRTTLWWGGLGNSTEHTAYLRLKHGVGPPRSGSMALNGPVVAQQIGAQIFVDGWAMAAPGDPELAADLARRASTVSHDGEAVLAAQVIAAMEAQAFVEAGIDTLIDTGLSFIPKDSVIHRMIEDIREWHAREPDWRRTREALEAHYGYDRYPGNCHVVPNHGLIVLGLLYGGGDFRESLKVVNTSGWDTDCNSGNLGCLLGIRNGLGGLDQGPDWRGPVADRLYLSSADGGRAITDALAEAYRIVNIGRALAGLEPVAPKDGARFHFELPGAVQGFRAEAGVEAGDTVTIENVLGHSRRGRRSLAIHHRLAPGSAARAGTPTFIPRDAIDLPGYPLLASPTLYPGQTVRAGVSAGAEDLQTTTCGLYAHAYGAGDTLAIVHGPHVELAPGARHEFEWRVGGTGGAPIAEVGVEIRGRGAGPGGTVYLDYLTWDGEPSVTFTRPPHGGQMWQRAWVNGVDRFETGWPESFRLIQNEGTGLLIQGTREWTDYRVSAALTIHLASAAGIAARVQGMRRYYALLLGRDGRARLVKALDGETVLAETDFPWGFGQTHGLMLEVRGPRLRAWIDAQPIFDLSDDDRPLSGGGVALVCKEGCVGCEAVTVRPCGDGDDAVADSDLSGNCAAVVAGRSNRPAEGGEAG